ncbi:hypothetical protein H4R34_000424 [Dimargaris verticillata]|uniref:MPN domain-containing protein n=1 Tax=Dimargaris verticillata TaxID=2761393 RepID=A0A9W8EBW2_9FUNG|nr:hypothetical protein H4R34_000424 [Dimargaris verticillata]
MARSSRRTSAGVRPISARVKRRVVTMPLQCSSHDARSPTASTRELWCDPSTPCLPIKELNRRAEVVLDPRYSISKYALSSQGMLQQARVYMDEGNLNNAYILYLRYTTLLLRELPKHPDYKAERAKKYLAHMKKCCQYALDQLERMKAVIEQRNQQYKRIVDQQQQQWQQTSEAVPPSTGATAQPPPKVGSLSTALDQLKVTSPATRPNHASSPSAVVPLQSPQTAYPPLHKASAVHHPTTSPNVSSSPAHRPGPIGSTPGAYPVVHQSTVPIPEPHHADHESRSSMSLASDARAPYPELGPSQASIQHPPAANQAVVPSGFRDDHRYQATSPLQHTPSFPSTSQQRLPEPSWSRPFQREFVAEYPDYHAQFRQEYTPMPGGRPGVFMETSFNYDYHKTGSDTQASPPVVPPKPADMSFGDAMPEPVWGNQAMSASTLNAVPLPTSFHPSTAAKPAHTTEGGEPLRSMHIPFDLLGRFLACARANTEKNLETCGILCGVLKRNEFHLTTLLIPKQTATSDTCTTTHEEELVEYQMKHDLLTLGWIHTHPTQTCFMSSLDLHTHFSYQQMLPEAIAIVCAPQYDPSYGIFRLTDPPGMGTINQCRDKRTFHPHDGDNIYTKASEPGHVMMEHFDFDMVDMR